MTGEGGWRSWLALAFRPARGGPRE